MKNIGFIINPIAGMGGSVGLKGTDGKLILKRARMLGAKPVSLLKADLFLSELGGFRDKLHIITGAGQMGEEIALKYNFNCTIFGEKKNETSPEDTKKIAGKILQKKVDLIIFCGGDGTARDILNSIGTSIPIIGVPTGVKMHSSVFAVGPIAASQLSIQFLFNNLPLREAEVMDVDEELFRKGQLSAKLYGFLLIPYDPFMIQGPKVASNLTENEITNYAAIAINIIEDMEPNVFYIIGPGTTTRTISDILDEKKTLLGVDIFQNKKNIAADVNENEILSIIQGKKVKIIVTPIGGQGFIFGRGNQQISSRVIRQVGKNNIIVIATKEKIHSLQCLRVDTGDVSLDEELRGTINVLIDYKKEQKIAIK